MGEGWRRGGGGGEKERLFYTHDVATFCYTIRMFIILLCLFSRVVVMSDCLRKRWRSCGKKEVVVLSSTLMLATGIRKKEASSVV